MQTIRALIVDDEKPGRERLRRLLARDNRVELVGCCAGGAEALETIRAGARRRRSGAADVPRRPDAGARRLRRAFRPRARFAKRGAAGSHLRHRPRRVRAARVRRAGHRTICSSRSATSGSRPRSTARCGTSAPATPTPSCRRCRRCSTARVRDGPACRRAAGATRRALDRIVVRGSDRVRLLPVEQISWIEADGMYVKLHTRDGATHLHRGAPRIARQRARPAPLHPHPPLRHRQHRRHRASCGRTTTATTSPCCGIGTEVRVGRRFRDAAADAARPATVTHVRFMTGVMGAVMPGQVPVFSNSM